MNEEVEQQLNNFIDEWQESANRSIFIQFINFLKSKNGVKLDFIARPGLTYSLRANNAAQQERDLFVMVDVIEGEPRWLSICFYGDLISDSQEKGDFVPEGLNGKDAICFDLEEHDDALINYIEQRMDEAFENSLP